jgi:predicted transcriptional regulator of viral defense system
VVRGLVSSGALEPQARGAYLVCGAPLTYAAPLWVALLATGGVLGFGTAAHLCGLTEGPPPRCAVIVRTSRRVSTPFGARVHRVFVPLSAVQRRDGTPITTRTWTLLDHLGELPYENACRLADRAFQRSWLRPIDVERRLRELPLIAVVDVALVSQRIAIEVGSWAHHSESTGFSVIGIGRSR